MRIRTRKQQFPRARSHALLVEEIDAEMVIFDEETKQAHCLTRLAAIVFDRSDGATSPAEIAQIASDRLGDAVSEEQIDQALLQLEERSLLASPLPVTISRREMVKKSAVYGAATAAAASLIMTIDAPLAQAAACTNTPCSLNTQCSGGTGCGKLTCTTCVSNKCTCT